MKIKKVMAKKLLTSNKKQTIEITINNKFTASSPLGTSTGKNEKKPFPNKGIDHAIKQVQKIKNIKIESFEDLKILEKLTKDLGANTTIALEFAVLKALSNNKIWKYLNPYANKLPTPLGNCIGGGKHFEGESSDIQEFLLIPRTKNFFNAAFANHYIYTKIKREFKINKKTHENAFVLPLSNIETFAYLKKLLKRNSKELGFKMDLGIDMAASSLWKGHSYVYENHSKKEKFKQLAKQEQISFVNKLIEDYDLKYIEDPIQEEDFDGFSKIKGFTVGDDLISTNLNRLKKAKIKGVIIKPNQIGSLIKTKEVVDYAKSNNIIPIISHRSGETNDNTIAHLAVAWEIPYIKTGIYGKERISKINELIRIEREI